MTFNSDIQKTEKEIAVLQKKLDLLKEIETHKSQPRMYLENSGKFEVVSYNDNIYYRLEYSTAIFWYMRKEDDNGAILLKQIADGETHRLLEGLWFNEIRKGNTQKIQSEIDELHKKFDVLQSQSATLSELNSVRRQLNIAYEKLRKN